MTDPIVQLCQLVAEKLQSDPKADLAQLVAELRVEIETNSQLAAALQTDRRMIQISQGNATDFQTLVEGGIANIGTHLHIDNQTLEAVLEKFFQEVQAANQPTGIPENLPRSGVVQFVGRDEALSRLHQQLQQSHRIAITAIAGMGGVGKTELALQYAQHHWQQQTYPGGVCWLRARDENIGIQIVAFGRSQLQLNPPEDLELFTQVSFC